jgi:hypothetical protein
MLPLPGFLPYREDEGAGGSPWGGPRRSAASLQGAALAYRGRERRIDATPFREFRETEANPGEAG